MLSISFTLCCVGLVFSSPAAAMNGTSVTCTKSVFSAPSSSRIWRIASRKGSDSISPTVPPISTIPTSTASETFLIVALISSVAGRLGVFEPFIEPRIRARFRAVLGHKNFTLLKGAHGARFKVQVRIALLQGDFETATFGETADGGGSYALSKRGNNPAGYKNIF